MSIGIVLHGKESTIFEYEKIEEEYNGSNILQNKI